MPLQEPMLDTKVLLLTKQKVRSQECFQFLIGRSLICQRQEGYHLTK